MAFITAEPRRLMFNGVLMENYNIEIDQYGTIFLNTENENHFEDTCLKCGADKIKYDKCKYCGS